MGLPKSKPFTADSRPRVDAPLVFLFNGDADGMVSQHMLGMHLGPPDLRITGLKRDIKLLAKLPPIESGHLHVLDISLGQNEGDLAPLLAQEEIKITWYDHHESGEVQNHPRLFRHILQSPGSCTGSIVHAFCGRRFPLWAAISAFGDNLPVTADALAGEGSATEEEKALLRKSGQLLNYNAYGESPADVLFAPLDLAQEMSAFTSALEFCRQSRIFSPLEKQFAMDEENFQNLKPILQTASAKVYQVPAEPWARRFSATWVNQTILKNPHQALAILYPRQDGNFMVSIRAPRGGEPAPSAADLAAEFPTGGGRKLAAGINSLAPMDLTRFLNRMADFFKA